MNLLEQKNLTEKIQKSIIENGSLEDDQKEDLQLTVYT